MIKILGLRSFEDRNRNQKGFEAFREREMSAPNIEAIFEDPEKYITALSEEERFNIYATVAECKDGKGRELHQQNHIPFDIDGIDLTEEDLDEHLLLISKTACEAIGVPFEKCNVLYSGNGIWIVVGIQNGFTERAYFSKYRRNYKILCERINRALKSKGLSGKADSSVWSHARLMRYPNTVNRKVGKDDKRSKVLNFSGERLNWGLDQVSPSNTSDKDLEIDRLYLVDHEVIMGEKGCDFLKWTAENQARVSEPQWYAALSISSRFPNGRLVSHELSKDHPGYSKSECDAKITQALQSSGPRTCENISGLWDGCEKCPNFGKVKSPIQISGPNFMRTSTSGFRHQISDQNGNQRRGKPSYEDLQKRYFQEHPYVVIAEVDEVFVYEDKVWKPHIEKYRESFAHEMLNPKPRTSEIKEFENWIRRTNVLSFEKFQEASKGFINLNNGVYDIENDRILPHSPSFYFTSKLPYDFDASATAPQIEKFLNDIACGDSEAVTLLLEFSAYVLFDSSYDHHKALGLIGAGANGKSTFIDLLSFTVGADNCSFVSMGKISDPNQAFQLLNKQLNISEETPSGALLESDTFKQASAGGQIQMKKLYKDIFTVPNGAKFIFASNHSPQIKDGSYGMMRRLILIPFNQVFKGAGVKLGLKEDLKREAPGFFNMLVKAYKDLKNRGDFKIPKKHQDLLKEVSENSNPILSWFNERIEILDDLEASHLTTRELFEDYKEYALTELDHRYPITFQSFAKRLFPIIPQHEVRKFNNGTQRGFKGLKFLDHKSEF